MPVPSDSPITAIPRRKSGKFAPKGDRGPSDMQDVPPSVAGPGTALEPPEAAPTDEERFVELPKQTFDPEFHSVEARVVYLGNNPNKSVWMEGTVTLIEKDHGEIWVPSAEGGTEYDFARFDTRGRLNKARLTADGKIWHKCRHIGHLLRFLQAVDADGARAFAVKAPPDVSTKIERFARLLLERQTRNTESGPTLLQAMGLS